ncbi:MAG: hypothetical protein II889_05415 [Clostridia bacterium]|nr:hypothetical protein [Clostridia bacterium]
MLSKRILAALLAFALCLPLLLAGCRKKEETEIARGSRYEGTAFVMPEGRRGSIQLYAVPPLWDEDGAALTVFCTEFDMKQVQDENKWEPTILSSLISTTADGIVREEPLPFASNQSVYCGWLDEDSFTYLFSLVEYDTTGKSDGTYRLGRYDRATGESVESGNVRGFFDPEHGSADLLVVDADGDIWIAGRQEILVFSPDFVYKKTIPAGNGSISTIGITEDGEIRAASWIFERNKTFLSVSAADKKNGTLSERFRCPLTDFGNPCFGPGMEIYYMTNAGVFGIEVQEDGSAASVPLMDYPASDVSRETAVFGGVIDRDRFLFTESQQDEEAVWHTIPVLYTRTDDADLSDRVIVTLAYTAADATLTAKIVSFNKSQKEVRIEVEDYSRYNTSSDPDAGDRRLATDLVTGVFRPDIVVSTTESETVRQLFAKKLCTDLSPHLAADDLVNDENLIGAVKHVFGDGHGGIRALSTGVSLITVAAQTSLLGKYAQNGFWNASGFADFVRSLPPNVAFAQIPCREYLDLFLTSYGALGEFIDADSGTCSFDGEAFRRVLELLSDLPPLDEAMKDPALSDPDAAAERFWSVKIALRDITIDSPAKVIGIPALFGTDDCTLIGLPTAQKRAGAGIQAEMRDAIVLTSFSEHPNEAWWAIRSFFEGQPRMTVSMNGQIYDPIPTLYSQIDRMIDAYIDGGMEFRFYADGSSERKRGDPEDPTDPGTLEKPGIVSFFREEDRARLHEILDIAGTPLDAAVDEEITAIVAEELSALYAGAASVDSCAKRIQSRVSIWLAEHK